MLNGDSWKLKFSLMINLEFEIFSPARQCGITNNLSLSYATMCCRPPYLAYSKTRKPAKHNEISN